MTRVSVRPQISMRRYQSPQERARRDASRLRTAPTRPRPTSAMRYWKPSRPRVEAPEWPWSWSMTWMRPWDHPNCSARRARSYWRAVLAWVGLLVGRFLVSGEEMGGQVGHESDGAGLGVGGEPVPDLGGRDLGDGNRLLVVHKNNSPIDTSDVGSMG